MTDTVLDAPKLAYRARLCAWVESEPVQRAVMALIVLNAITLGLETSDSVMAAIGGFLTVLDIAILAIFTAELALRIAAHGLRFFRGGWNWFDLIVVAIALVPASGPLSVLRALRVLRVLRLISIVPSMRSIVEALLRSLPGMSAIMALLLLVFYVFAVMGTKLFGDTQPERREESPLRQPVEGGELLGKHDRVAPRQHHHAHPELQFASSARGECHGDQRIGGLAAESFTQPEAVEPKCFEGIDHLAEASVVEFAADAEAVSDADFHRRMFARVPTAREAG